MSHHVPDNFGGILKPFSEYKNAAIAILPVPFDKTSTWGKGADKGPAALIAASQNVELYDIETDSEVYRRGICTDKPVRAATPDALVKATRQRALSLLADGKFIVALGGEHSIAIGVIQAQADKFRSLSVLHLDAHSDRRDRYEGSRFNHACVMARAQELTGGNVVSVGIRSLDRAEKTNIDPRRMFYAHQIRNSRDWIARALKQLTDEVYVSLDLDVFDSGIMPSTGTPEPGGLDWYQVNDLLREVCACKNVVGCDVVELCPSPHNKAPDFLAARLVFKILSYKFRQPKNFSPPRHKGHEGLE
ncbi:MAG: agmatinase [Candidatus Edwardsbacteria bacterium]|nr:agmatinase [Candidatus Edwardsbacteria bacterium]